MVRIAERDDAAAMLLRARDSQLHRFAPDDLAESGAAVESQQRPRVEYGPHVLVRSQAALLVRLDVTRQHADTMRVVTGQVGLDQIAATASTSASLLPSRAHKANRSVQARNVDQVRRPSLSRSIWIEPSVARS